MVWEAKIREKWRRQLGMPCLRRAVPRGYSEARAWQDIFCKTRPDTEPLFASSIHSWSCGGVHMQDARNLAQELSVQEQFGVEPKNSFLPNCPGRVEIQAYNATSYTNVDLQV